MDAAYHTAQNDSFLSAVSILIFAHLQEPVKEQSCRKGPYMGITKKQSNKKIRFIGFMLEPSSCQGT